MSGSTRQKLRSEIICEHKLDDGSDGTSARTRPLSYDEIMLKRKGKKELEGFGEERREAITTRLQAETTRREETVRNSDRQKRNANGDRHSRVENASRQSRDKNGDSQSRDKNGDRQSRDKFGDRQSRDKFGDRQSRDTNGAALKTSREYPREASPRKVDKISRTNHSLSKSKNKERHKVESRSKHKTDNDVRIPTESKKDKQDHVRRKADEHSRGDDRHNHDKKHHRDSVAQDRYIDRNGVASERESKRKDRSGDDEKHRVRDHVKKHDSGSRQEFEISGRKGKTEFSRSRHDEARSKRRRSRSQEHTKDKAKRSRSPPPKARKNVSDHAHHQRELSSHSEKDRSRHHPDGDRSKMSIDGSNSHEQRHGESFSGIGGYSPRKRKSEAAVKTPSPIRSPERKSAGWDLLPSGVEKNLSSAVPSGVQLVSQTKHSNIIEFPAGFSVASSMGKPISALFSNSLSAFKQASVDSVQLTQATRPMRRLYIDNIPSSVTEKDIMECFNTYLLSSGSNFIRGTHPCISCMIHKEKGQALVEFLTPEDASAALSFDGRYLSGSILKIRRPKDYVEVPVRLSGTSEKSKAGDSSVAEVSISDIVKDSPHKIFVGGIAEGLTSEMIMEILGAFGTLKAYRFEVDEELKEPRAFLEYADQSVTLKACAGLNGMKLGGRVLTVAQAFPNTEFEESSGQHPFYGIPEHVKPLLEMPTQVLKLSNVLDQKEMDSLSETEMEEILEDVRLECSRFGSVVSINVVKGGVMDTFNSEAKETHDVESIQPPEERNHHSIDLAVDHEDGDGSCGEPPTNINEFDAVDSVEGDTHERCPATDLDVELGATETSTVEESEKNDKILPQNLDDIACRGPQEDALIGVLTVDDTGNVNDSEGNNLTTSTKEIELISESNPDETNGIKTSGDGETLHSEDVPELEKTNRQVVSLPTNSGLTEKGRDIKICCDRRNVFEVGCVLVEFRRTEASCMAAHYLHGRAFDDRFVAVEYVPLKAYQDSFPK